VKHNRVLITGGTGSFGQYMTKYLINTGNYYVRIFSRDEQKQEDMRRQLGNKNIDYVIGDVRDYQSVKDATEDIETVLHASALKIITTCEENPLEALKTNTLGTYNVKKACIENEVHKAILISTDKAVKPINFYGMSKAMAEKIFILNNKNIKPIFNVVRYGNVLSSRGSVIPYFRKLIQEGKSLPITDFNMTRFLLPLYEAIDLVMYAMENSDIVNRNCIYVPKINSCKISDLAKTLAGEDYPLHESGIRQGEKVHECLINEEEMLRTEDMGDYYIIKPFGWKGHLSGEYTSNDTVMARGKLDDMNKGGLFD
jgi:UDP-glucose 4-epimerase